MRIEKRVKKNSGCVTLASQMYIVLCCKFMFCEREKSAGLALLLAEALQSHLDLAQLKTAQVMVKPREC